MKIALITDSTCALAPNEIKDNNVTIIPIPIIIGKNTYFEGIDIDADKLFTLEREGAAFPKTSQPSVGGLTHLLDSLHTDGYEAIIAITLSSGISGFYSTLETIAKNKPEYGLHPFDSKMTVRAQGELVLAAAKMIKADLPLDKIMAHLTEIRDTIDELFVVDDLKNLSRGGRLSNAEAFFGSMLHIKPLLTFEEGEIVAIDKIRSMKRAMAKIEELALSKINTLPYKDKLKLFVIDSNDASQAKDVTEFIKKNLPDKNVTTYKFSPVIATHLGEKSLAICWMIDIDKIDLNK